MGQSRLFNVLVVFGSGISAGTVACGRSTSSPDAARSAMPSGGTSPDATGGAELGGGPSGTGGGAPTTGGAASGGDSGAAGVARAGTGATDPGPSAQWDCVGQFGVCRDTSGAFVTPSMGLALTGECVVDTQRPRSASDCATGERLACTLAIDATGAQSLVNCSCEAAPSASCGHCTTLTDQRDVQANCTTGIKICPCANTSILK